MTAARASKPTLHRRRLMALLAAAPAMAGGVAEAANVLATSNARALPPGPPIKLTSPDSIADYLSRNPQARTAVLARFAASSSCR